MKLSVILFSFFLSSCTIVGISTVTERNALVKYKNSETGLTTSPKEAKEWEVLCCTEIEKNRVGEFDYDGEYKPYTTKEVLSFWESQKKNC